MDYAEAADHAESLFFAKNAIGKAVVSTRMQQRAERLEFDMRTGGDSTARLAIQAVTPLAAVRCIYLGQAFLVYQPEKWLDVMERSLLLFRQRFGDKSYKAIQHRYVYHWTVRKISVIDEKEILLYVRWSYAHRLVIVGSRVLLYDGRIGHTGTTTGWLSFGSTYYYLNSEGIRVTG